MLKTIKHSIYLLHYNGYICPQKQSDRFPICFFSCRQYFLYFKISFWRFWEIPEILESITKARNMPTILWLGNLLSVSVPSQCRFHQLTWFCQQVKLVSVNYIDFSFWRIRMCYQNIIYVNKKKMLISVLDLSKLLSL